MGSDPRLIYEYPNYENTIAFTEYQASSPEKFSLPDDDKFVLYAAGSNYSFLILDKDPNIQLFVHPEISSIQELPVDLFVLNTSFLVWCDSLNKGIEFPYQGILLHALQEPDKLYLQVSTSDLFQVQTQKESELVPTIELVLSPNSKMSRQQDSKLLSKVPDSVESVYHAMSKCSAMHFDSENEDQTDMANTGFDFAHSSLNPEFMEVSVPNSWVNEEPPTIHNTGDADDLECLEESHEEPEEAGMHVDIGFASIAGAIRRREHDEEDSGRAQRSRPN
ncbi:low temperature responsive protein [Yamadazyma tenuis]|uniref:Protein LOT5 n=1 Tax=Candida tenuis (strain ATCC 10573 / BCRC 21748 / CBS 615 / JCM 9827 / NBRC 10315 / NRRL Y-1498 / VKM Y-70) TaxID=590646 RepID=G3AY49_CANTC|nr:low temperature responsive protein [Yamadazyma tenuis ATCC 10573]XP_006684743.1 uncharacterized protein CANTEDRAFT_112635 [Yamadazyma tenuis ATCC 10573]EGV66168.1 low temperature responsive protein [Yamadazyma tenuis ATCC 10573]EGV66169.1 hypothetical protein CANTEDRAFT_112635 [Yamadazyma tenuis ATCC 10573]WEJ95910.1 low temperature responsive protein [Yamadazyma tenuis]